MAGYASTSDEVVVDFLGRCPACKTGVAGFAGIAGLDMDRRLSCRQFGVMTREAVARDICGDVVKGGTLPRGRRGVAILALRGVGDREVAGGLARCRRMGVVMAGCAAATGDIGMNECCRFPARSLVAIFASVVRREMSLCLARRSIAIMAGEAVRAEIGVVRTAARWLPCYGGVAIFAVYGWLDMSGRLADRWRIGR